MEVHGTVRVRAGEGAAKIRRVGKRGGWTWWGTPVIPLLRGQEQSDFQAIMGYIARICLKGQQPN